MLVMVPYRAYQSFDFPSFFLCYSASDVVAQVADRRSPLGISTRQSPFRHATLLTTSTLLSSSSAVPNIMKVKIKKWHAVATWRWDMPEDEVCGICRVQFDGTCPTCKFPGDDCTLLMGKCGHSFHMVCRVSLDDNIWLTRIALFVNLDTTGVF